MKAINIVLLSREDEPSSEFVEIESDDGKSIKIGEVIHSGEYWKIRITPEDILNS